MTEPLQWRDSWLLGIDLLDDQHREMARLINRVLVDDAEPIARRLDALIAHLRRHFHIEDVFLRSIGFPDAQSHSREHTLQLAEFIDLRRSLARGGAAAVSTEDGEAIRQWFFSHVVAEDGRFGAYYRQVVCGQ